MLAEARKLNKNDLRRVANLSTRDGAEKLTNVLGFNVSYTELYFARKYLGGTRSLKLKRRGFLIKIVEKKYGKPIKDILTELLINKMLSMSEACRSITDTTGEFIYPQTLARWMKRSSISLRKEKIKI